MREILVPFIDKNKHVCLIKDSKKEIREISNDTSNFKYSLVFETDTSYGLLCASKPYLHLILYLDWVFKKDLKYLEDEIYIKYDTIKIKEESLGINNLDGIDIFSTSYIIINDGDIDCIDNKEQYIEYINNYNELENVKLNKEIDILSKEYNKLNKKLYYTFDMNRDCTKYTKLESIYNNNKHYLCITKYDDVSSINILNVISISDNVFSNIEIEKAKIDYEEKLKKSKYRFN